MMMINSCPDIQQDTLPGKNVVFQDTVSLETESDSINRTHQLKGFVTHKSLSPQRINGFDLSDSTSVCGRNSISDVTFYDSNNIVINIESDFPNRFPFLFIEKTRQLQSEERASLIKHLKPGQYLPVQQLHDDWMIGIILIVAFLFSFIKTTSRNTLSGLSRFFLYRRANEPSSRDISGLFHWQSTILNLISFLILGLFAYCTASFYNFIPSGISGIIFWFISLGIIISAITIRHIVCLISGIISGEKEVFREYLVGVYQSYRFSALFLFVLIILMVYTVLLPAKVYFISGIIALGIMYLIRVIRLMIIFINRNISIFYLILYLCALEILPVLISVKYFTGLI